MLNLNKLQEYAVFSQEKGERINFIDYCMTKCSMFEVPHAIVWRC